jgi:adenylate cyclase
MVARCRAHAARRKGRNIMALQPFREWLVQKSWAHGVYYSKAVACLLPPAALADRLLPRLRRSEAALNAACAGAMVLATWVGAVHGWMWGDLAIYAAGATFVAAVMCTPSPVRRPLYVLSFLVLGPAAGMRAREGTELLAALVNPFCVVVLCIELDKFMHARNAELCAEMQRAESERAPTRCCTTCCRPPSRMSSSATTRSTR